MGFRFCCDWKDNRYKKLTLKYNNETVGEIPIEALASKHRYTIVNGQKLNYLKKKLILKIKEN